MGRSPCCSKEGLNRGAWTALEDKILTAYIKAHGEGKWRNLPKRAGLKRCGKSCRLRWLNYLRPDIKRGNISHDEEELIIRLHKLLGNRWSLIAGRLPGRTDNEIKNYWNTTLGKKANAQLSSSQSEQSPPSKSKLKKLTIEPKNTKSSNSPQGLQVIRTRATRCTKVLASLQSPPVPEIHTINSTAIDPLQTSMINHPQDSDTTKFLCGTEELDHDSDFLNFGCNEFQVSDEAAQVDCDYNANLSVSMVREQSSDENMLKDWNTNICLEDNATLDLESLAFLLEFEEWA